MMHSRKASLIIMGIVHSLLFIMLSLLYYDFVLDDAFITYRYAKNLANNHGLVWNISEKPVEGYTSFLWVIINAAGIRLSVDPVVCSKVVAVAAGLAIIWILVAANRNIPWWVSFILVGAVSLSPAFAFLTMQGMETTLTALLLLISGWLSMAVVSNPGKLNISLWYMAALLSLLSRPDTIPFNAGILLGLIILFVLNRDHKTLRIIFLAGVAFTLISSLYMIWRYNYFGHLFPNPFYIKFNTQIDWLDIDISLNYISEFAKTILLPYIIFTVILRLKQPPDIRQISNIIPILSGCILFSGYLLFARPGMQAFLWRFIFPVFPAFLLALIYYLGNSVITLPKFLSNREWQISVLLLFAVWPLHLIPLTLQEKEKRTQADRVIVGKALAGIPATIFITETGAVPYYSECRAVDMLGITSEEITHKGLSLNTLTVLNPDLIMVFQKSGEYLPNNYPTRLTNQYMLDSEFIAVAAINKSKESYHYYFVRRRSEFFDEIVKRLRNINTVKYGDLGKLIKEKRMPRL